MTLQPEADEVKRSYRSPRRAAQAEETRSAILDAAHVLFVEDGYAATSIKAIAAKAGVAEQTIYAVFGDKASIAAGLFNRMVTGSDDRAVITDTASEVAKGRSLQERIRIAARISTETARQGLFDLRDAIGRGAASDPRLAELVDQAQEISYRDTKNIVEAVIGDDESAVIDRDRLIDSIWALTSTFVYRRLVGYRRWTHRQYEDWLVRMLEAHGEGRFI